VLTRQLRPQLDRRRGLLTDSVPTHGQSVQTAVTGPAAVGARGDEPAVTAAAVRAAESAAAHAKGALRVAEAELAEALDAAPAISPRMGAALSPTGKVTSKPLKPTPATSRDYSLSGSAPRRSVSPYGTGLFSQPPNLGSLSAGPPPIVIVMLRPGKGFSDPPSRQLPDRVPALPERR